MGSIIQLINQWNASRLELFKISQPDKKHHIFHGVMRFFYESRDKYHSKCIRVSSEMTVAQLLPLLWEKFAALNRRQCLRDVGLFERSRSIDKLLGPGERPLLIQLCWCQDDKEGVFVLRALKGDTAASMDKMCGTSCLDHNGNPCLSKYCDQDPPKSPVTSLALANSYLSRTISNPESLMRHRRKTKLEAKLQQIFKSGDINGGGTLKIYGESINPMIPYKSLLLSVDDTAAYVVREILDKYCLEKEDANDYCLVKVTCQDSGPFGQASVDATEEVLQKNDSPLNALLNSPQDPCFIKFKVMKCPPHLRERKKAKKTSVKTKANSSGTSSKVDTALKDEQIMRYKPKAESFPTVENGTRAHLDSGIESQQSCSHSALYPSVEQLPIYDTVNNNVYSTPPFSSSHSSCKRKEIESRPLPSYEESIQRSRMIKFVPTSNQPVLSPFGGSFDSFSLSSDCMEDVSCNRDSVSSSLNNIDEVQRPFSKSADLSQQSDLDAQLSRHLPVQITYFKSKEDLLLDSIILEMKPSQIKFKLSLAYVLHLMVVDIIRLTCINKTSRSDQELIIGNFIEKVTTRIRQSIMPNRSRILMQSFWLANCTEFLYLLKNNPLLSRLKTNNFQRLYEQFAENTQCSFQYISCCFREDVVNTLPVLLLENVDDDDARDNIPLSKKASSPRVMSDLVRTLSSCMSVLQQCHVNSALIIQIMSRIFHLINSWIFNKFIDQPTFISGYWAMVVTARLDRIRKWSAANDLQLAADCYLQRCIQMCHLILIEKTDVEVLYNDSVDLIQINSVQLRYFLENYSYRTDEPQVPQIWIDFVASGVAQVADKLFEEEGVGVELKEKEDLDLPLLLPDDGYHVDTLFGCIPEGFIEYLDDLHREWCFYKISHQNIHFDWLCQKTSNKEIFTEPPRASPALSPPAAVRVVAGSLNRNSSYRHQLTLADFKGNITSAVTEDAEMFLTLEKICQENSVLEGKFNNRKSSFQSVKIDSADRCSTYASSFMTEVADGQDLCSYKENKPLQLADPVKYIDDDGDDLGRIQSTLDDFNRCRQAMPNSFNFRKSKDDLVHTFRQTRQQTEMGGHEIEKSEATGSNPKLQIKHIVGPTSECYNSRSNTFPVPGSIEPQSFVSTSLALRNTLNYPPKIKPKPRFSSLPWRGRSYSVVNMSLEEKCPLLLDDIRPRSKSSDRYYSKAFDGMENLTFQEKVDMFEYGIFSTSH